MNYLCQESLFTSKSFPTKFFHQINNSNFQADVDFRSTFNRTPPKSPTLIKKKKKDRHKKDRDRKTRGKKEKEKRHTPIVSVYPIFHDWQRHRTCI